MSLFSCHHKYVSATICMKPILPRSRQWCVCSSPSSHGILIYLYYLASAPQTSLNPIRLAMSSVVTGWAILPRRPPCVWSLWAHGAEEGKQNPHEGLPGRSVLKEGHEENPITTSAPIFMLGSSKGGYFLLWLSVTTSCLPTVQPQSSKNKCPPFFFSLILFLSVLTLFSKK